MRPEKARQIINRELVKYYRSGGKISEIYSTRLLKSVEVFIKLWERDEDYNLYWEGELIDIKEYGEASLDTILYISDRWNAPHRLHYIKQGIERELL